MSDGAEAASTSPPDAVVADASAERAAHALALILEREPRTLDELTQAVGATPAEVAALIDALERHELVAWAAGRSGLRAGPAALRFARSGVGREDLAELAEPSIRRLADESGETANLIVPRPAGTEAIAPGRRAPPARRDQLGRARAAAALHGGGQGLRRLRRGGASGRPAQRPGAGDDRRSRPPRARVRNGPR